MVKDGQKMVISAIGSYQSWSKDDMTRWAQKKDAMYNKNYSEKTTHLLITPQVWREQGPSVVKALARKKPNECKVLDFAWFGLLTQSGGKRVPYKDYEYKFTDPDAIKDRKQRERDAKQAEKEKKKAEKEAAKEAKRNGRDTLMGNFKDHTSAYQRTPLTPPASSDKRKRAKSVRSTDSEDDGPAPKKRQTVTSRKGVQILNSSNYHIYEDKSGLKYDITLIKVDTLNNANRRLNLIFLQTNGDAPYTYACMTSLAGTGMAEAVNNILVKAVNFETAFTQFKREFKTKTGIDWAARSANFPRKKTPTGTVTASTQSGPFKMYNPSKEFEAEWFTYRLPHPSEPAGEDLDAPADLQAQFDERLEVADLTIMDVEQPQYSTEDNDQDSYADDRAAGVLGAVHRAGETGNGQQGADYHGIDLFTMSDSDSQSKASSETDHRTNAQSIDPLNSVEPTSNSELLNNAAMSTTKVAPEVEAFEHSSSAGNVPTEKQQEGRSLEAGKVLSEANSQASANSKQPVREAEKQADNKANSGQVLDTKMTDCTAYPQQPKHVDGEETKVADSDNGVGSSELDHSAATDEQAQQTAEQTAETAQTADSSAPSSNISQDTFHTASSDIPVDSVISKSLGDGSVANHAPSENADKVNNDGKIDDGGKVNDGDKVDGGKVDGGKVDGGKVDGGKVDGGKGDGGQVDGGKVDGGQVDDCGKVTNSCARQAHSRGI